MLKPITQKMTDESEGGIYMFTFYCDLCGGARQSDPYQSMSEDVQSPEKRENEHEAAYERANRAAMSWFNRCPVCKRYVCDKCFRILDDIDKCVECAGAKEDEKTTRE